MCIFLDEWWIRREGVRSCYQKMKFERVDSAMPSKNPAEIKKIDYNGYFNPFLVVVLQKDSC